MSEMVYKIARRFEWEEAEKTGIYPGSADDRRDGFIHLSSASQVYATCSRYFAGESEIILVSVESSLLGPALKWEESRRGEKFPHLYAPLVLASVHSVTEIRRSADGRFMFPPEIP
jgi:uncharacterized protein (DUF952 family)